MKIEIPIAGTGSPDEVSSWMRSERINWYPETAGDARSKVILRTAAGLTQFASLNSPHRGARTMGETLYVVQGQTLFSVASDGSALPLGEVVGSGRCVLTDGFVPETSRQLVIGTGETGYVYDTVDGFSEITNTNFVTNAVPSTPVYVGGYYVWPTADGIIWSDISDPSTYPPLNFRTAETVTDGVVGIALVYGDIWICGKRSIEVARLSGQADENAFALAQTIDYGTASPYGVTNADNGFFFLDDKKRVYRANGFTPVRVSTHQIEQYLDGVDCSEAWLFNFVDRGHEFVGMTIPGGETHLYDVSTQVWSRRKSFDEERWRVNTHAYCYGKNLFGDFKNGKVWELDKDVVKEGSDLLVRELYTQYVHSDTDPLFVSMLEVLFQTGTAAQTGDYTSPVVEMRYSDNGGADFCNFKQRSLGAIGQYNRRVRWDRLGRCYSRVFNIRISDPVRADPYAMAISGDSGAVA